MIRDDYSKAKRVAVVGDDFPKLERTAEIRDNL